MFIPTIHECPIAKNSSGLIEIEPVIIGKLAGAVREPDEWLIVLLGTKSRGGLHIIVDEIYVPTKQKRTGGTCEFDEPLPNHILPRIVGALHSHNKMSAKFSGVYGGKGGDRGDGGLNMTFPMSIVISSLYSMSNQEAVLLGFDYSAEGKFDLPCGALGLCEYSIIPKRERDWPFSYEASIPSTEGYHKHLGDCSEYSETDDSTKYQYRRVAACGLEEEDENLRESVFGFDYDSIVSQLPKRWEQPRNEKGKGKIVAISGYHEDDNRDREDLDRWSSYDEYIADKYGIEIITD